MAVHIQTAVYIDGINRTSKTVLPIKFGNFLDERLDECNLSLRAINVETFSPLTPVEIRVKSTEYFGNWKVNPTLSGDESEEVYHYIIANDTATEVRPGSGLFNHELYLLEVTKVAECIIVDALTYTNDIGRNYTEDSALAQPQWS